MLRNKLIPAIVFGISLVAWLPSTSGAEEVKVTPDLKSTLERLEQAVKDLQSIERKLADNADSVRILRDEVAVLKNRVALLESEVRLLANRLEAPSVTAKREAFPEKPKTGKVRLINNFVEEMSVRLNDRSYRLMPGEDLTVSVPAGNYVYQILNLQANPQVRAIDGGETKEIRIVIQR